MYSPSLLLPQPIVKSHKSQLVFDQEYVYVPRGAERSVERCISTVTAFMANLASKYGRFMKLRKGDLYTEKTVVLKKGKIVRRTIPAFQAMRLTPELLDEYVEKIEVHPENEVRISWK